MPTISDRGYYDGSSSYWNLYPTRAKSPINYAWMLCQLYTLIYAELMTNVNTVSIALSVGVLNDE